MESKSSFRSQLSFVVSMILHGAVIALIALGPSFLGTKGGDINGDKRTTVDFTVDNSAKTITPALEQPAAAPIKAEPVAAPVTKKIAAKSRASQKNRVAKTAPAAKTSLEPQQPMPAENTETPLEKTVKSEDLTANESPVAVAQTTAEAPAVAQAPAPQEKPAPVAAQEQVIAKNEAPVKEEAVAEDDVPAVAATDAAFADDKSAKQVQVEKAAAKEEAPKAAEPAQLPAPVVKSSGAETAAANSGSQNGNAASTIAAASAASGVQVVQTYTGLKQVPGNKPPSYTRDMRFQKAQGAGQLVYFVNKNGSISDIKLTKSTGVASLDKAAVDAFSKYKFVPGQEGFTVHNFEFSLKGPAISDNGRLRTSMK